MNLRTPQELQKGRMRNDTHGSVNILPMADPTKKKQHLPSDCRCWFYKCVVGEFKLITPPDGKWDACQKGFQGATI
jgi:hypothetical protein